MEKSVKMQKHLEWIERISSNGGLEKPDVLEKKQGHQASNQLAYENRHACRQPETLTHFGLRYFKSFKGIINYNSIRLNFFTMMWILIELRNDL